MTSEPPKANPLFDSLSLLQMDALHTNEEFKDFYVKAAEARNAAEQDRTEKTMLAILASRQPCHILFSGHLGCGKSTELRRLGHMLEQEKYLVGIGVCDKNLDMTTVQYTDLILFILETLLKCAKDKDIPVRERTLKNIESYWKDEHLIVTENKKEAEIAGSGSAEVQTPTLLAKVFSMVASVRSSLSIKSEKREEYRRELGPNLDIFINMINDFIDDIREAGTKKGFKDAPPVVLLDQLEKADTEAATDLFEFHSQDLVRLRLHLVIPFPIDKCYKPSYNQIRNHYSDEWILPMIKLRTWEEQTQTYTPFATGKEVLREIIFKRIDEGRFADGVLDHMIEKTGGFLRDLFRVIYDAALNAVVRKSYTIEKLDMTIALDKLQSSISRMFPDSSRPRLERIKNGEKRYAFDEELMVFLRCGAVFEYNGKRWVDLHPLVLDWLNELPAREKKEIGVVEHEE